MQGEATTACHTRLPCLPHNVTARGSWSYAAFLAPRVPGKSQHPNVPSAPVVRCSALRVPTREQVSTVADADRVEKLGVTRIVGAGLVLIWLAVLVLTIVLRRRVGYAAHEPLLCALARAWAPCKAQTHKGGRGIRVLARLP